MSRFMILYNSLSFVATFFIGITYLLHTDIPEARSCTAFYAFALSQVILPPTIVVTFSIALHIGGMYKVLNVDNLDQVCVPAEYKLT